MKDILQYGAAVAVAIALIQAFYRLACKLIDAWAKQRERETRLKLVNGTSDLAAAICSCLLAKVAELNKAIADVGEAVDRVAQLKPTVGMQDIDAELRRPMLQLSLLIFGCMDICERIARGSEARELIASASQLFGFPDPSVANDGLVIDVTPTAKLGRHPPP